MRTNRIDLVASDTEMEAITLVSRYLKRSRSDALRFLARKAAEEFGLIPPEAAPRRRRRKDTQQA
jgi:hypothetical protein